MTFDEYRALDEETRMRVAVSQALAANVNREMPLVDAPGADGAEGAGPVVDPDGLLVVYPDRLHVLHGAKGGIRRPGKAPKSSGGQGLSSPKSRTVPADGTKAPRRRSEN